MTYGRRLWELFRCISLFVAVSSCAPHLAQARVTKQTSAAKLNIPRPDVAAFLPARGVLIKQLIVDFKDDGGPNSIVLAYTIQSERDRNSYTAGVRILQYSTSSKWTVAFEENNFVENGGGDAITVEKVKSSSGKEAVVVILKTSGAGTATDWHVIAEDGHKFFQLDPTPLLDKVLKDRAYEYMGYNGVASKGDLVIEELPGYSHGSAACCPDRPSIEVKLKFTGASIQLDSVKTLKTFPFTPPKH